MKASARPLKASTSHDHHMVEARVATWPSKRFNRLVSLAVSNPNERLGIGQGGGVLSCAKAGGSAACLKGSAATSTRVSTHAVSRSLACGIKREAPFAPHPTPSAAGATQNFSPVFPEKCFSPQFCGFCRLAN